MRFNCVNCLFSKQVASLIADGVELYACLRYPPVSDLVANAAGQPVPVTRFPAVNASMMCGEYRPAHEDPGSDSRPLTCGATHLFMNRIDDAKTN